MANVRWIGGTTAVAQVDTYTPATVEVDDIFTLTVTAEDGTTHAVNFTATAATVANVCTGLAAAWNADTDWRCTPMTAADGVTEITLTADSAGVPFYVASTTTDGGGNDTQTLTRAATTANAGPYDWNTVTNWDGGAVPGGAAAQDVFVEAATVYYGLDQSGIANTLASLNIARSVVGTNGAVGRASPHLQVKATIVDINYHWGPGTAAHLAPVNVDTGATASTITVYDSGTNATATSPAVRIKAAAAGTTLTVWKGRVGVANESGETATLGTITVTYASQLKTDATVDIGEGVTLTTLVQTGGDVTLSCAATTVTANAGTLTTAGSGAITTLNINGGTTTSNSSGTITNLNVNAGICDLTKSQIARTITTAKLADREAAATLRFDPAVITLTNDIQPVATAGKLQYVASTIT